jgi:solute carrier family 25 carnitine/acylcarnitine transporter 20/29
MEYFGYGLLSGIGGTLISHPFDTIKTYLQNREKLNISIKTPVCSLRKLYSGVGVAIIGLSVEKMLVFGIYSNLNKNNPGYLSSLVSGMQTGALIATTTTLSEQIKIDKQLGYKTYWNVKYLYKGFIPTLLRESIGFGIYFTTYKYLSNQYNKNKSVIKTGLFGSCACVSAWVVIFPIDTFKTHIQSNRKMASYSIKYLYKGIGFGLMRAIPFHGTCFIIFEWLNIKIHL